jgi:iron complex outermembrane receptor protein
MMFTRKSIALAVAMTLPAAFGANVAAAEDKATTLPEVTVSASKVDASQPVGATLIDEASLAPKRSATSDTASLLSDVPGVSLYGNGGVSGLPVIHGLGDDRLRIKVDGMDLISACGNHMNPPLSYIDPSNVRSIQVFSGIAPVSLGGDSIGGTIVVNSPAPEFAAAGQGMLLKGEAGAFYRSNGNATGGNVSATIANENLSMTYSGSTVQSDNYKAGGDFKKAGPAYINPPQAPAVSAPWLAGDEVGSTAYESDNHSLGFALRNENHLVELKVGYQHIPYQGYPNQRMDMTDNKSNQVNLRYTGQYDWGTLQARAYHEHTRHKMDFLEDKEYWYYNAAAAKPLAGGMPMDTEGRNTGALVKADILLSARDTLRVGGEYQRYRFSDWWDPSGAGMWPNTFWDINDGQRDRYAAFAEWEARWSPQWLSQLGVRSETVKMDTGTVQGYNTGAMYLADATKFNASDRSRTDNNWDMTALARYTQDSSKTYEFGYARKTRSPNLYERYAWSTGGMAMNMINTAGDGNGYVGNVDLKPEVAHTLSATADWHDAEQQNWGLKVTPYFTYVQDYINARRCTAADGSGGACTLAAQTTSNNFVFLKYLNQDARLYGLDVSGYFPLAKNTAYGSFTATGMLNYVRGKTASGADDDLYNIMPLNAKLAVVQHLGSWTNTAEVQMVAAKDDVSQIRNELKTSGYGLLNLRSSYTWKKARFDVGIDNVFDRLYDYPLGGAYVGQGRTMPPTGGSPYGIAVPGMGRSIYAGVNVKF